ncbi:protein of unknown function [Methanoculleus bourgensis]|uniref:Uncharacterized protein n=1 Tax=Methanoculleus bourgensis TaxID=83986 RepID=A0A0X3BPY2_9EURY|nr:protein of unknown function [Methanoculleus bourgensis]
MALHPLGVHMNLPTPPGFGPGYAAQRYSHTPMTRLPPGIAMYCSRRRGWGLGYPPRSSVLGLVEKNLIPSISVPHLTFSGKPSLEPLPIHGFPLAIATDRAGWGLRGGTYGYSPAGRGDPLPQWQ